MGLCCSAVPQKPCLCPGLRGLQALGLLDTGCLQAFPCHLQWYAACYAKNLLSLCIPFLVRWIQHSFNRYLNAIVLLYQKEKRKGMQGRKEDGSHDL